ncbi:hypothetical protein D3C80_1989870 [compost metagenome]
MRVGDRCIAHQRVQPPELPQYLGHPGTDLRLVGNVHGDEPGVVTQRLGYLGPTRAVQVA